MNFIGCTGVTEKGMEKVREDLKKISGVRKVEVEKNQQHFKRVYVSKNDELID